MAEKRIDQFFKECDIKNEPVHDDNVIVLDTHDLDDSIPKIKRVPLSKIGTPAGGNDGQILAKDGADDHDVKWVDAPAGIPDGGSDEQVLAKDGETDYSVKWINKPADGTDGEGVPEGGDKGDILVKDGSNDFETDWKPLKKIYEKISIPVEYMEGHSQSAYPIVGNSPFVRAIVLNENVLVTCELPVPQNMKLDAQIKLRLRGVTVQDSTINNTEFQARFTAYAWHMGDDVSTGMPNELPIVDCDKFICDLPQYSYFYTAWSCPLTVTNLESPDDLLQIWFVLKDMVKTSGGDLPFAFISAEILYEQEPLIDVDDD